jgi:hypothetical protein
VHAERILAAVDHACPPASRTVRDGFCAIVYAGRFAVFDVDSSNAWWRGALLGLGHGILDGLLMGMTHFRVECGVPSRWTASGNAWRTLLLEPPGLLAKNYGPRQPRGVVMAHVIYGLMIKLVYSLLT